MRRNLFGESPEVKQSSIRIGRVLLRNNNYNVCIRMHYGIHFRSSPPAHFAKNRRRRSFEVSTNSTCSIGKVDLAVSFLIVSERSDKYIRSKISCEARRYPILLRIGDHCPGLQVASLNRFWRSQSHSIGKWLLQVGHCMRRFRFRFRLL